MTNSGIYTITSPSGNVYVGSAFDFGKRWQVHRHHLRNNTHHSAALQAAWNKYGEAKMVFAAIIACPRDLLLMYEQLAMDALRPKYNMKLVAGNASGWKHTPEARAKMSAQRTGVKQTAERIAARVAKVTGKKRPADAIARSAAARRGSVLSDETKAKLAAANLGKKYGPMSDEHKRKIGAANSSRARTEKDIAAAKRLSERMRGKKHSAETKAKRLASYLRTVQKRKEKAIADS